MNHIRTLQPRAGSTCPLVCWDTATLSSPPPLLRRFSLVIVDNIVRFANLEAGGELTCSASDPVLEQLSQV